jgi:hypothetical protein
MRKGRAGLSPPCEGEADVRGVFITMRRLLFFLRQFFLGLRWSWRRAHGRMPVRRGAADHRFVIAVEGPAGQNHCKLSGTCTREDVHRLLAFLAVHEEPIYGVCVGEHCALEFPPAETVLTGVGGDFRFATEWKQ